MKKIFLLGVCLLYCLTAYPQVLTVRDQASGKALEMVSLLSERPQISAVTNAKGQVDISAFRTSEKIEISIVGHKPEFRSYAQLEADGFKVFLLEGMSLDEVVVSASRWNQIRRQIPSKVTSISPASVALQNPQTSADLLGSSGEVFIQKSQQGGGSPMIRGFSTNRLLISVDGVRMNTAIFRGGNIQNVISLDPFATEHTEVLFGPGSVIYGSDAIGGVMSFQTLTPQLSYDSNVFVTGKTVARYSSASNERTGHLDVNLGWKKWASLTSFSYSQFDDLRMGRHGPSSYLRPFYVQRKDGADVVVANKNPLVQKPTAYSQLNLMQKIRFKPNDKWDFQYGFHYATTSDYSRYDRLTRTNNAGIPRSAEWNYGPQVWMMNNLNITHTANNGLYDQLVIRLAHQLFEESRMDRNFNNNNRFVRIEKVNAYSANVDFTKAIGARHNLVYGLEEVHNHVNSIGREENIATGNSSKGAPRYPQSSWDSYAVYLTYRYKLSEKVSLHAGARYNQFVLKAEFDTSFYPLPYTRASINSGALTGSLGAVYSPGEKWFISTNLSTGFRSPNVDDMGKVFDSEPGSVVVPNPGLKAEYAYNAEASVARIFGEVLKLDLTGYYTFLDNALVRRDYLLNGEDSILYAGEQSKVQAIQNAAHAYVYGIQVGFELKLPKGFSLASRFNFQEGREELDNGETSPLRHAAPWFGVSRLGYSFRQLKMDLNIMYSGEVSHLSLSEDSKGSPHLFAKDAQGRAYAPGWYTLNLKVLYSLNEHFALSGGVENITDQRYRTYTSGLTAPGRNFILSLRAVF